MANISNYLKPLLLNHMMGKVALPLPANLYLGFFQNDVGADASGTEASGFGYARQLTSWTTATQNVSSLAANVSQTPVGGDWATISHWGLFDALTLGNLWLYGQFDVPRVTQDGVAVTVDAGTLSVFMG